MNRAFQSEFLSYVKGRTEMSEDVTDPLNSGISTRNNSNGASSKQPEAKKKNHGTSTSSKSDKDAPKISSGHPKREKRSVTVTSSKLASQKLVRQAVHKRALQREEKTMWKTAAGTSTLIAHRPKRVVLPKNLDETSGLSWREETDLKKALLASLQESRRTHRQRSHDNSESIDDDGFLPPQAVQRQDSQTCDSFKTRDETSQDSFRNETTLKKQDSGMSPPTTAKVHAQRKFAQNSAPSSPSVTPVKFSKLPSNFTKNSPNCKAIVPSKKAKTEDFLTFLCLRGTPALPPKLEFFNYPSMCNETRVMTPKRGNGRGTRTPTPVKASYGDDLGVSALSEESTPSKRSNSRVRDQSPRASSPPPNLSPVKPIAMRPTPTRARVPPSLIPIVPLKRLHSSGKVVTRSKTAGGLVNKKVQVAVTRLRSGRLKHAQKSSFTCVKKQNRKLKQGKLGRKDIEESNDKELVQADPDGEVIFSLKKEGKKKVLKKRKIKHENDADSPKKKKKLGVKIDKGKLKTVKTVKKLSKLSTNLKSGTKKLKKVSEVKQIRTRSKTVEQETRNKLKLGANKRQKKEPGVHSRAKRQSLSPEKPAISDNIEFTRQTRAFSNESLSVQSGESVKMEAVDWPVEDKWSGSESKPGNGVKTRVALDNVKTRSKQTVHEAADTLNRTNPSGMLTRKQEIGRNNLENKTQHGSFTRIADVDKERSSQLEVGKSKLNSKPSTSKSIPSNAQDLSVYDFTKYTVHESASKYSLLQDSGFKQGQGQVEQGQGLFDDKMKGQPKRKKGPTASPALSGLCLGRDTPPPKRKGRPPGTGKKHHFETRIIKESFPGPDEASRIVEVPIYRPSPEQFQDPMTYIASIRSEAEQFGMCQIIPPDEWKPECRVQDDLRFVYQIQYVQKMQDRWGPNTHHVQCIRKHLESQGIQLEKQPPNVGGIELDLARLSQTVQHFGGMQNIIDKNKWVKVADALRIPKMALDRATKVCDAYLKFLMSYDSLPGEEKQWIEDQIKLERQRRRTPDDCVVKGKPTSLANFYRVARNTKAMFYPKDEPSPEQVEYEYWKIVRDRLSHVAVHCGHIDTKSCGSGFPNKKSDPYYRHAWNFKNVPHNTNNLLKLLGPVESVTVPTLHVGMLFSTSCWSSDPHLLPYIVYMHTGADMIWYSVPKSETAKFQSAMFNLVPDVLSSNPVWLPEDTAMVSPSILMEHGVSVTRAVQRQGQFIVVFPQVYTSTISCGYNVSESVHFATPDWIPLGCHAAKMLTQSCEAELFPIEQMLLMIVRNEKTPLETLRLAVESLENIVTEEIALRRRLIDAGLKIYQRIDIQEDDLSTSPNRRRRVKEFSAEEENICESCKKVCYFSMVVNETEDAVYSLHCALPHIQKKKNRNACKLMYRYTEKDLTDMIVRAKARMQNIATSPTKRRDLKSSRISANVDKEKHSLI